MFRKPVLLLIKCCVMLQAHPELFLTAVRAELYSSWSGIGHSLFLLLPQYLAQEEEGYHGLILTWSYSLF